MRKVTKCGSNCGCYCLLFQNQTEKRSVQCHVFAQSPSDRRLDHKYPVYTSHRNNLCKTVSLLCCLVATVIHMQSVRCQICVYVCMYTHTHKKVNQSH